MPQAAHPASNTKHPSLFSSPVCCPIPPFRYSETLSHERDRGALLEFGFQLFFSETFPKAFLSRVSPRNRTLEELDRGPCRHPSFYGVVFPLLFTPLTLFLFSFGSHGCNQCHSCCSRYFATTVNAAVVFFCFPGPGHLLFLFFLSGLFIW